MIYNYVKKYLKNKYSEPTTDFKWDKQDIEEFFQHIEKRYTKTEFTKEISEVKVAFRDFFEPVATILFRYTDSGEIKIKVFPYRVKPENSKHLQKIIEIIKIHRKHIKYNYNDDKNQIAILGKIRREINSEILDSQESINKKELIRYAIRKALSLTDKDVVISLKRKFIIKLSAQDSEASSDKYNGYSESDIKNSYSSIFDKDTKIEEFLQLVMKKLFANSLNFRTISNQDYETNAVKFIQLAILKELGNYINIERDFLVGLTSYIVRKYFHYIHELMAIELLEAVYEKNKNANQFLLYYNGKVIVKDGKKYKIPSLETEDGQQLNNATIIAICNIWVNIKLKKEQALEQLEEVELKIKQIEEVSGDLSEALVEQRKQLVLDIKAYESNLEAKKDQIDPTIKSVVQVLMSRKKLVK